MPRFSAGVLGLCQRKRGRNMVSALGLYRMRRNLQVFVSLVLVVSGSVVSAYYAGQLSARRDCDSRYSAFIKALDEQEDLRHYFSDKGREDYYLTRVLSFHPSGWRFGYVGERDCGLFVVGGAAVGLLGVAGILDTCRGRNAFTTPADKRVKTA
jgi:hypothetical protein